MKKVVKPAAKKVVKKIAAKKPIAKAQAGKKLIKNPPTKDSTAYFNNQAKKYESARNRFDTEGSGMAGDWLKAEAARQQAIRDAERQKFKGAPHFDKNGYPLKKKNGGVVKKTVAKKAPVKKVVAKKVAKKK